MRQSAMQPYWSLSAPAFCKASSRLYLFQTYENKTNVHFKNQLIRGKGKIGVFFLFNSIQFNSTNFIVVFVSNDIITTDF